MTHIIVLVGSFQTAASQDIRSGLIMKCGRTCVNHLYCYPVNLKHALYCAKSCNKCVINKQPFHSPSVTCNISPAVLYSQDVL